MYEFRLVDMMDKIVADMKPPRLEDPLVLFSDDRASFQLAFYADDYKAIDRRGFKITVDWPDCRIRREVLVPVAVPTTGYDDGHYISKTPCMLPDRLEDCHGTFQPVAMQWRGLWIDLFSGDIAFSDERLVSARVSDADGNVVFEDSVRVLLVPAKLDGPAVHHTEWFHVDCLADYYHLEPYCDRHWEIIESFMRFLHDESAADMLYTPLLTPPLDTYVGGERTTVQLVDVEKTENGYTFGFDRLKRWASLARRIGFENLELSHLFTQWGAEHCPKTVATENGRIVKLFGWENSSLDAEYTAFLSAMIPAAIAVLGECGYDAEHLYFHISDEPRAHQMATYVKARGSVEKILAGMIKFDALSSYDFYATKAVDIPVVAADHIDEFIEKGASPLWVYYCVSQGRLVPNRFISLPNYRSRMLGVLMYMNDVKGFLHWGYNFYNSQYSTRHIDPYVTTDADSAFPSGDPFLVYPGKDGCPVSSIRNEVLYYAFRDIRILRTAERLASRKCVMEKLGGRCAFAKFPQDGKYLSRMIGKVESLMADYLRTDMM